MPNNVNSARASKKTGWTKEISEIRRLHGEVMIAVKMSLEKSQQIGKILHRIKETVGHGEWMRWCRVNLKGISHSSIAGYMRMHEHKDVVEKHISKPTTLTAGLRAVTDVKKAAVHAESEAIRDEMKGRNASLPDAISLHRVDCREHAWPDECDLICTDPPWGDMGAYEWLAGFCASKLRTGGLILVQVGTAHLATVLDLLRSKGKIKYVHTLVFSYNTFSGLTYVGPFATNHRPVLVLTKNEPDWTGRKSVVDSYIIRKPLPLPHHPWEQPLEPWITWLRGLSRPGDLILDPFAGAATTGVAARDLGDRRWVGTEIDQAHFEVARGRLQTDQHHSE